MNRTRQARIESSVIAGSPVGARSLAVVGAGLLGLLSAWRLAASGAKVTLFDANSSIGGMMGTTTVGAMPCDRTPLVVSRDDTYLLALLDELGLSHRLRWHDMATEFHHQSAALPGSAVGDGWHHPELTRIDRWRLMATLKRAAWARGTESIESISATRWLRPYAGHQVMERILRPWLQVRAGVNLDEVSAAFILPLLADRHAGRSDRIAQRATLAGGYGIVLHALTRRLNALGVDIRTNTKIRAIASHPGRVSLKTSGQHDDWFFGDVVVTLAPASVARLCPQLDPTLAARLRAVPTLEALLAVLRIDGRLSDAQRIEHDDPRLPFGLLVQQPLDTGDTDESSGQTLVYSCGLSRDHVAASGQDINATGEALIAGIQRLYPAFDRHRVRAMRITQARRLVAITTTDYRRRHQPPADLGLPGIHLINAAQATSGVFGPNDCLQLAAARIPALIDALHERCEPLRVERGAPAVIGQSSLTALPVPSVSSADNSAQRSRPAAPPLDQPDASASSVMAAQADPEAATAAMSADPARALSLP